MSFSLPNRFLAIDEEGYPIFEEKRVTDENIGRTLLSNLRFSKNGCLLTTLNGEDCVIEAFNQALVIRSVAIHENGNLELEAPYHTKFESDPKTLSVDEWDRFHGYSTTGLPFVLSRPAQVQFFDLLEEFDDESITINGHQFEVPEYWQSQDLVNSAKHWTATYTLQGNPAWNLGAPAEALTDMLPRLKIPKARILVPGCGEGHDAALFAKEGHVVTAVDFSEEAISRAKQHYGSIENLHFVQADIFEFAKQNQNSFDYLFEHTCFCAINPTRRNELVRAWNQMLTPDGQLIAVLFAMDKKDAAPFGGSEWEYRQRLQKYFHFLFWGRWQKSVIGRQGKELFILAKKRRSE